VLNEAIPFCAESLGKATYYLSLGAPVTFRVFENFRWSYFAQKNGWRAGKQ